MELLLHFKAEWMSKAQENSLWGYCAKVVNGVGGSTGSV